MSHTIDPDTRDAIKEKHPGELRLVEAGDHALVFKKPSRLLWDEWIEQGKTMAGMRLMARDCCVYPDDAEAAIKAMTEDFPATLANGISDAVLDLAGLNEARVSPF